MPTPTKGPRMGGSPAHERHMLANLAQSLFEHGRITTTEAKAKRLRPYAEHLITFAKKGDLHSRRQVLKRLNDKSIVHVLFEEIGPRFATRPGGYTRIVKLGPRKGDNAPMAIIELVEAKTFAEQMVAEAEAARGTRFAESKAPTGATLEAAEELAAESPTAAAVVAEANQDVVEQAPVQEPVEETGQAELALDTAAGEAPPEAVPNVPEVVEAAVELNEALDQEAAAEAELAEAKQALEELESAAPEAADGSEDEK